MSSQTAIAALALLTLVSNIIALFLLGLFIYPKAGKSKYWKKIENLIVTNSLKIALVISLTATLGSLYFSEVAGFEPCKLCWFQRIFMYPLPIIIGVSLWKNYKSTFEHILPLALLGLTIAIYHYYSQISANPLMPCSTVGFSVSCSERFFTYFGYITIPWMSFSAFSYIFILTLLSKKG